MSLKVSELHKSYPGANHSIDVLTGITFEMEDGESLVITGPSGSGKSTLLHCLGTLDSPTTGKIQIDHLDPFALPDPELARFRNKVVGFVFQDHHLLPQYSVLENVLMPALAFPSKSKEIKKRATTILDKVGISSRLDHIPSELSGGERQRVAVARALLNRPSLLLCDEPTGNLDHNTAESVTELLFELHKSENNILIVATHNLDLASRFQRRFELQEGKCVTV